MSTTPTTTGPTDPKSLRARLIRQLPDPLIFGTRELVPGQTTLQTIAAAFVNFALPAPSQAEVDTEAARRTAVNADPRAAADQPGIDQPLPGAKGAAQAARRFGTKAK